jgi:hypothetical protein
MDEKRLLDKTLNELTVKDGIKLYFIAQLCMSVAYIMTHSSKPKFTYTPNPQPKVN